jgi:hypothetical protein
MAVDDEVDVEQAIIEEWRGRAGGHEGAGGEWDEVRGKQTLNCPVVRIVRPFLRREGHRVVKPSFTVPLYIASQNPCHHRY